MKIPTFQETTADCAAHNLAKWFRTQGYEAKASLAPSGNPIVKCEDLEWAVQYAHRGDTDGQNWMAEPWDEHTLIFVKEAAE